MNTLVSRVANWCPVASLMWTMSKDPVKRTMFPLYSFIYSSIHPFIPFIYLFDFIERCLCKTFHIILYWQCSFFHYFIFIVLPNITSCSFLLLWTRAHQQITTDFIEVWYAKKYLSTILHIRRLWLSTQRNAKFFCISFPTDMVVWLGKNKVNSLKITLITV